MQTRDSDIPSAPSRVTSWLESLHPVLLATVMMGAAFSTYFCMYAFRKPFAAGKFQDLKFFGSQINLKTAFVISQTIGYALSKYLGIKVCSEVTRQRRPWMLILLILSAELALLLFAVLPLNAKFVAIFLNGLPIGMVWGLVVQYLEGRRNSELLLAGLSCSFIVASGSVKDVGLHLMSRYHLSEWWMPFATGLLFLPLFLLSVWLLNEVPSPSMEDIQQRVRRVPMTGTQRKAFVRQFLWGLIFLMVVYFFLTAYRDFRDNFAVEIRDSLGYQKQEALFTRTELLVAFGVMAALSLLSVIKDNRRGLIATYLIMAGGLAMMGISTMMMSAHRISGFWWFTLVGLGSYLAYVPYGSILFDRLIASTRIMGTAVFAIYIADALGYTGSLGIQLYKDLVANGESRFAFFIHFTYFMALLGTVLIVASGFYFASRKAPKRTAGKVRPGSPILICPSPRPPINLSPWSLLCHRRILLKTVIQLLQRWFLKKRSLTIFSGCSKSAVTRHTSANR